MRTLWSHVRGSASSNHSTQCHRSKLFIGAFCVSQIWNGVSGNTHRRWDPARSATYFAVPIHSTWHSPGTSDTPAFTGTSHSASSTTAWPSTSRSGPRSSRSSAECTGN
ncbi:hypothetical protein SV7mr_23530 [Stieleria bergensis]|uniref:Uncharacterized protein n=1 Tax=Stieleria bergensis TaxID=2528025 RepID=A0A517SUP2_9BACT|nr:hypothetical protein SV7mr_23530 [Planctomycetes bacterium SV_7m_r]